MFEAEDLVVSMPSVEAIMGSDNGTHTVPEASPIIVNHVMSNDTHSQIFNDIIEYFRKYSPPQVKHVVTGKALEGATIYHYHRPQLESRLVGPSICTIHHDLRDPDPWLELGKFLPRYQEANALICLNTIQRWQLTELGFDPKKLHVIPHGYRQDLFTVKPMRLISHEKKITLGIVSRRYPRRVKGEAYLMDMVMRLDPSRFRFLLVGRDRTLDAEGLRRFGFEAEAYDRLPYQVFNSLYHELDFLLMASWYEGGPANIPEAVATGTPVLAFRVGMAADHIQDGVTGLFLKGDPQADGELINCLAGDQIDLANSLLEKCQAMAGRALTWNQSIEKNIAVYQQLIN